MLQYFMEGAISPFILFGTILNGCKMHHFQLPSSFQTSAQVTITIDDVNDNAPVFEKASYQANVKEVSSMTNMKVSFRLSN